MLTVACVLSEPPENKPRIYRQEHVERLHRQAARNLSQPFWFECITDSTFPGWWAKIDLFKPGRVRGRVLYLDLDVSVIDDLDSIANYPAAFCAMRDPSGAGINSSVMAWNAGHADHLYTHFSPDVMKALPGDQHWIHKKLLSIEKLPNNWCVSYRFGVMRGMLHEDTKVIVYHGDPKPWTR